MPTKDEARRRVRVAAARQMGLLGFNIQDLMAAAKLDRKTVTSFLNGQRWPHLPTLKKLEEGLEWPAGSIATMLEGAPAPVVGGDLEDRGYVAAPGDLVDQDVSNAELLAELRAVREDVNALSRRVARIESGPEPVGGADGEA
jgi:hypothetical protein